MSERLNSAIVKTDQANNADLPWGRIVHGANRLPFTIDKQTGEIVRGKGGLVTSMDQMLRLGNFDGAWAGSASMEEHEGLEEAARSGEVAFHIQPIPIVLSDEERQMYYNGYSNEVLWLLFHNIQPEAAHLQDEDYYRAYMQVQKKFARSIAKNATEDDYILISDYHLTGVASEMRKQGLDQNIGFFLHIPFPKPHVLAQLPKRDELIENLLCYNQVGLHTNDYVDNFLQCVQAFVPDATIENTPDSYVVKHNGRKTVVKSFPISIDVDEFEKESNEPVVIAKAEKLRSEFPEEHTISFGTARLDPSKGILHRLQAIDRLLEKHPELVGNFTHIESIVPSREGIPIYDRLLEDVERLVAEINSKYADAAYPPIRYQYRNMGRVDLLAHYRIADIALVTPYKDGMNLVIKEMPITGSDKQVAITSKTAGAAQELTAAFQIDPFDIEEQADTIYRAIMMTDAEKIAHHEAVKRQVEANTIGLWSASILKTASEIQKPRSIVYPDLVAS